MSDRIANDPRHNQDMTTKEKHAELSKIIPGLCNVVRGFMGPILEVDVVGVNTEKGIQVLPPFSDNERIVELYWSIVEDEGMFVVQKYDQPIEFYKRDDVGWIKETKAAMGMGIVPTEKRDDGPKILLPDGVLGTTKMPGMFRI